MTEFANTVTAIQEPYSVQFELSCFLIFADIILSSAVMAEMVSLWAFLARN